MTCVIGREQMMVVLAVPVKLLSIVKVSYVTDIVKWEAALCSDIIKQATLKQMWTPPESKHGNECKSGFKQDLGWNLSNCPKRKVLSHNGSIKGFAANMTRTIRNSQLKKMKTRTIRNS